MTMKHLFDKDENYVGSIDGNDYNSDFIAIDEQDMPKDYQNHLEELKLIKGKVVFEQLNDPKPIRKAKLSAIKAQVKQLLDNSAWRVERAAERDNLGIDGETPQQVYAYREAIRQAGDRAERELEALDNVDDINAYHFEIRPSDYPVIAHLTHLQFLRRFNAEERAKIAQLRAKSPQINDYFTLLELAKFVNPYDPDVILGVNMLEQMGIIGQGRAGQILNGAKNSYLKST